MSRGYNLHLMREMGSFRGEMVIIDGVPAPKSVEILLDILEKENDEYKRIDIYRQINFECQVTRSFSAELKNAEGSIKNLAILIRELGMLPL